MLNRFRKLGKANQVIIVSCWLVLAAVSVTVWLVYLQNHRQESIQQPATKPYRAPVNSISGKPVGLNIPSLRINLPVIDGQYDDATHGWTLSLNKAQYLVDSARPNNIGGKTFIYGHYRREVFASLHNIQSGASLSLTTDNGYRFNYRFRSSFTTDPSDLSVLDNTDKPVLYVQTCSGVFFQHRQIFSFTYVGYEKIKV